MAVRWKAGFAAAIDQAWVSLLNLSIALVFVRFGEKSEYGIFVMLMSLVYLVQSFQNALILSPLATLLPAAEEKEKATIKATALKAQTAFLMAASMIATTGFIIYDLFANDRIQVELIAAFVIAVAGISIREGMRSIQYCQGRAADALKANILYGGSLIILLALNFLLGEVDATSMLLLTGAAAIFPFVLLRESPGDLSFSKATWNRFWNFGRWGMIGASLTWFNLYAYPLVVGFRSDVESVAEINAARLFLTPFAVGITAWSNLYRPKISGWFSTGHREAVRRLSLVSIGSALFCLGIFSLPLVFAYPLLESVLGDQYSGLRWVVFAWVAFFSVSMLRTVFMATLMTNEDGYKTLQNVSLISLCFSLMALWFASPYGTVAVVGVLCAVELFQAVIIGRLAWNRWKPA